MKKIVSDLLHIAQQALEENKDATASTCLDAALILDPTCIEAHNLREIHQLPGYYGSWMGVKGIISPQDDIFRFFAHHPTSVNPVRDYLADGWRTLNELRTLLELRGRSLRECHGFLEFASGHGRLTRHLVNQLPAGALTVSDVVDGAVEFLQKNWNVAGFNSTPRAAELMIPQQYQIIFVLSLFTHLPREHWVDWIRKLYESLELSGLLIFTTHGEKCIDDMHVKCEDGYAFLSSSESSVIDASSYGTTFMVADQVIRIVQQTLGNGVKIEIVKAHFWGNQDAVILQK